ncbi:hypothetical protein F0562_021072 [Nyssa sinensis]|uniref:Uncharacterized protein n=1 Tax=Nyssa sinensis TaxID=561372 RepID=A0A5J5BK41_9ASTE|nr:hypothetical protein F0562_021072 [Nyssa sinensis]
MDSFPGLFNGFRVEAESLRICQPNIVLWSLLLGQPLQQHLVLTEKHLLLHSNFSACRQDDGEKVAKRKETTKASLDFKEK